MSEALTPTPKNPSGSPPKPLELFTNTADGVLAVDGRGRIILWNDSAEKILGFQARDVMGKLCCEIMQGRDGAGNLYCLPNCNVMGMVRLGQRVQNYDMQTHARAGQLIWLNVSTLTLPGNRPGQEIVVHFFRDITSRHRLQELVRERGGGGVVLGSNNGGPDLTRRELQILRMVAEGLRTQAIAEKLNISEATVRNHVQNILTKLEAHSRLEAVAVAMKQRLL